MREPFVPFMEREIEPDSVVITCGLPATNKTETMEVLARLTGHMILRTDLIRREVLKGEDVFDENVASDMDKRTRVYEMMFKMAADLTAKGQGVILDATFVSQELRRRAAEVAARSGKTFVIQETRCPQTYSLNKIAQRTREDYESNALTPQAYHNNVRKFESVDLDDLKKRHPRLQIVHLTVDTAHDDENGWFVIDKLVR
jgi:hypothetical protein